MKKLVLSALALGAMTSVAMAGELVPLTSSQLDQVAAGNPCSSSRGSVAAISCDFDFTQLNALTQTASAGAAGGCNNVAACGGGANGNARAKASNWASQSNFIHVGD